MNHTKKPVILITGYLGSGKTTLMQKLLMQEKRHIALIVNDMGAVNIDAAILHKNRNNIIQVEMVEMQNGCICCTLRDEFIQQIERLADDPLVEAIFVEASGISEPSSIAASFLSYLGQQPDANVYLSSVTSVVDADRVHREFLHRIRSEESAEDGDIINLIMDQIEFCDLIVLNKTDLLTQQQVDEVRGALREIQQKAEIISCVQGEVAFDKIVHGRIFNYDAVADSSVMQRTLDAGNKEACTDEYGISSFLYEDRRPLNRDKFVRFVENYPEELIRTKGYVWFSDDPVHAQLFEQAGRNASITEMTEWMCAIPQQELDALIRDFPDLTADWDEQYGDRIVQLVFIGKDFRQEEILGRMEGCTDVSCPVSE